MSTPSISCPVCGCARPAEGSCPVCMLGGSGLLEAERIFQLALSYHIGEREAFVATACREDAGLLEDVRLLLRGYAEEGGDDGLPTVPGEAGTARAAWALAPEEEAGGRIGHFELVRLIGRGGMGSVWAARQTKPVVRQVALKVIKLGMDTREVVARFERERQTLALMDHPNIARVYEAGATELGRPYFVMELVLGRAITWFCQEGNLDIRARLELFLQLCGAMEHAHQKGVIHRDLKPSNILVTAEGDLKVIDFGVAKATRETGDPDQTRMAQVLGTPAYMSPEQASGNGVDVDTRTDVYALGVVLYELLCGMLPFDPERLSRTGMQEMQRILREEEPMRPSTQWNGARLPGPADPWRRALKGDLDLITLKCLEKDRHHRYTSARALADDVEAYLENRPVTAAPHRTSYYVRKWVARHRVAFAAGVAVAGSLLLGTIVSLAQARRAGAEAARATTARAEAERLLVISHREEGKAWLERARGLQKDRNFSAAKLMAGRAVGFEGFGRDAMDAAFQERYPVLLDPTIPESAAARRILASFGDFSMIWQSPSSAHHDGPVRAVVLSPDGSLVASCGPGEDVIRVRETGPGGLRFLLESPVPRPVTLDFSPDGKWLAAGGESARVPVWDVATGQPAFDLEGTERRVTQVHFSADGSVLGVSGATGGVTLWDMATRLPQPAFGAEYGPVTDFSLSRDAKRVAVVTVDAVFRLYDLPERKMRWEFRGPAQQSAFSVMMHPDGKRLYGGFALGKTLTWDLETGKLLPLPFDDHRHPVMALRTTLDGRILASANSRGAIRLSDAATGKEVRAWEGHPSRVLALAISGDGRTLVTGGEDRTLRVWNGQDGKARFPVTGHTAPVVGVAVSPDGRTMASAAEDQTIQIWDPAGGRSLTLVTGELGGVRSLDFSPSGAILMAAGRSGLLRFWKLPEGERTIALKGLHAGGVNAVKFVRESVLASAGSDGAVRVYQAATGNEFARHLVHRGEVLCLDVEPGGRHLASGGMDRTIVLWEPDGSGPPRVLQGHVSPVTAVRFSPDGRTLASADRSGTLRFWDVASGLLKNSLISSAQPLTSIDYHPDGSRLTATGLDGVLRLWNVMTWKLEAVMEGHLRGVQGVRFSQDGAVLVSGSDDHTVALWQARGEETLSRQAHRGPVSDLLWDDGPLTTAGADGMVRQWEETWLHRRTEWEAGTSAAPCLAAHGPWLVIGTGAGHVQIRSRQDGTVVRQFHAHRHRIDAVLFSPDGRHLATTSQDGKVRIWETGSWNLIIQMDLREVGGFSATAGYSLAFSRDGSRLFSGGDRDGRIRTWLTATWAETESLPAHPVQVRGLHHHPRLDLLAAAGGDGTVSIWNTLTLQQVASLKHHTGEVFDARFDPSGRWLASAGEDQTIVIWDTASWQVLDVLEGCIGAVHKLHFDATGGRLASGGDAGQVKIWDLSRRDPGSWATLFSNYRNDGLRFTTQSGVTAADLAQPLTPRGAGAPLDSWLETRRGNPSPALYFQQALQARNWEGALYWLGQLSEAAPQRGALVESLAQEVLQEEQDLPPARVDGLLAKAEALLPGDVRLRQARARQAFRQGKPAEALTQLGEPATPAIPEMERLRYQILLGLGDLPAAGAMIDAGLPENAPDCLLVERYQEFSATLHQRLTPPTPDQAGTGLDTLRALTLVEHFRRAASLIPYDEPRLKAWIAQITEWRALVTPPIPIIPPGAVWHYQDDGSDPGPDWLAAPSGPDPWPSGGAPLGVSLMKKTTTIRRNLSGDPALPSTMTFFFRHAFPRPELAGRPQLLITTQNVDALLINLNGREIRRINMDPGPVTVQTGASQYQNKPGLTTFSVPAALLQEQNVLAARVHQREPTSTDIFFDVTVSATAASTENWLANLSPEEMDSALASCAGILPPALAASWLPLAKFALADEAGTPPPGSGPALPWLIRARLQHALGRLPAMEHALAAGRAAIPPDIDQRTALDRDLWQHLAEVPLRTW